MRRRELITLISGAAVTWPLVATAQQPAVPVIGLLSGVSAAPFAALVDGMNPPFRPGGFTPE
jgi:putative tryptophan/tyrosine transport system substrate-binding protein